LKTISFLNALYTDVVRWRVLCGKFNYIVNIEIIMNQIRQKRNPTKGRNPENPACK